MLDDDEDLRAGRGLTRLCATVCAISATSVLVSIDYCDHICTDEVEDLGSVE